ncbi:MAG: hypothetical protein ACYS76_15475 [Planctomycetota bacterium]|jgi:hypothetical protein
MKEILKRLLKADYNPSQTFEEAALSLGIEPMTDMSGIGFGGSDCTSLGHTGGKETVTVEQWHAIVEHAVDWAEFKRAW